MGALSYTFSHMYVSYLVCYLTTLSVLQNHYNPLLRPASTPKFSEGAANFCDAQKLKAVLCAGLQRRDYYRRYTSTAFIENKNTL